jgi:hypothetical protein
MSFSGFAREALGELQHLPTYDAARYAERRELLHAGLLEPARALVTAIAGAMGVPLTTGRGSVSPLHTDLRFAQAGAPRYKDHVLLTAWHGADKKVGPTLWIRVDSASVGLASGVVLTPGARERWREAVGGTAGARLASTLDALRSRHARHELEVAGDSLQKVPAPWPGDHPRAELLRKTGFFQVRFRLALPRQASDAKFVAWCVEPLKELVPVHRWLVRHVLGEESQ